MALIQDADYNDLYNRILPIYGTGSAQTGYGQTMRSSNVIGDYATNPTTVDKASAADWNNLYLDIIGARIHQVGSAFTPDPLKTGNATEKIFTTFATYLDGILTDVEANKALVDSTQIGLESYASSQRTTNWNGTIIHEFTAQFANADQRRAFFNAGGEFRFTAGITGGSGSKTNDWRTLLSDMGTIKFGSNSTISTGTGTAATTTGNFQITLASFVQIFRQVATIYTVNDYYILVRTNAAGDQLRFQIRFQDDDVRVGTSRDEDVTGTITSTCQLFRPNGSFTIGATNYTSVDVAAPTLTTHTTL